MLAVALVLVAVASCGSGAATPSTPPASGSTHDPNVRLLSAGLAANLDRLTSYQFAEDVYSGADTGSPNPSASAEASAATQSAATQSAATQSAANPSALPSGPVGTRALRIVGTVVNGASGPASVWLSLSGRQYTIVGSTAWTSSDGVIWTVSDDPSDVLALLPAVYYGIWFEPHVASFTAVGQEQRNGIECTRFSGSDALGLLYASATGASLQADLWVANDGSYPVGGRYLIPVGSNYSGYSFEITAVNDAANVVAAPTNVVALPT